MVPIINTLQSQVQAPQDSTLLGEWKDYSLTGVKLTTQLPAYMAKQCLTKGAKVGLNFKIRFC